MHPGFKEKNIDKNAPQTGFFIKQNVLQTRFFDYVLMGTLSY